MKGCTIPGLRYCGLYCGCGQLSFGRFYAKTCLCVLDMIKRARAPERVVRAKAIRISKLRTLRTVRTMACHGRVSSLGRGFGAYTGDAVHI